MTDSNAGLLYRDAPGSGGGLRQADSDGMRPLLSLTDPDGVHHVVSGRGPDGERARPDDVGCCFEPRGPPRSGSDMMLTQ